MVDFLISSIVVSVTITVVLNVVIRVFPGTSADERARQMFGEEPTRPDEMPAPDHPGRVRVYFPWKQMLLWSASLSVVLNAIRLLN
jgi:hypothetical protein